MCFCLVEILIRLPAGNTCPYIWRETFPGGSLPGDPGCWIILGAAGWAVQCPRRPAASSRVCPSSQPCRAPALLQLHSAGLPAARAQPPWTHRDCPGKHPPWHSTACAEIPHLSFDLYPQGGQTPWAEMFCPFCVKWLHIVMRHLGVLEVWAGFPQVQLSWKLMLPAGGEKPLEYLNAFTWLQWLGAENDLLKHLSHICFITSLEKQLGGQELCSSSQSFFIWLHDTASAFQDLREILISLHLTEISISLRNSGGRGSGKENFVHKHFHLLSPFLWHIRNWIFCYPIAPLVPDTEGEFWSNPRSGSGSARGKRSARTTPLGHQVSLRPARPARADPAAEFVLCPLWAYLFILTY